jgi:prepilin signal peptidase PulO-like enzyme (type II secretory pathway)
VIRETTRGLLGAITWLGTAGIVGVWYWGEQAWIGLLTALVGLAASGGLVWIVRKVGTAALQREAMGFGDVTLMMMIGTFLGWQACVIVFFVSPFAAVGIGIAKAITQSDDEIPYGPFLCLGALFVMVFWAAVWNRVAFAFELGWLMPTTLAVCFVLLGVILFLWQQIKRLFRGDLD